MIKLLTIVEVEKENRVFCQAPCCKKTVHKRIHVVEENQNILVIGSQCFKRLFGEKCIEYTNYRGYSSGARRLTAEERNLLISNTRLLIDRLESEILHGSINLQHEKHFIDPTSVPALQNSREVSCTFCGTSMTTRAKSMPAVGYKCSICMLHRRPAPSARFKITREMNSEANRNLSLTGTFVTSEVKSSAAADAYRKATGK